MRIETRKLLADVTAACASIESFVAERSFDHYPANEMLRAAVERKFGIVGEALTRLRATDPSVFNAIEDAALIVGLRNRLIHGNDAVDDRMLWDSIQNDLPKLKATVERMVGNG